MKIFIKSFFSFSSFDSVSDTFITVGFSIDVSLLAAQPLRMLGLAGGLVALKAVTLAGLGKLLKLSTPTALRTGALCAQSGEFAFVAFGQ